MTCTTVSWTVVADAPGYVVLICTEGGAIGGYCSIGSATIDNAPATMIRMAMTIAKIGRSMKNLAMLLRLSGLDRRLDGTHQNSRLRFLHPGHDHPLAFVQSALHHPLVTQGPGRLDDAQLDLVVRTDHEGGGVSAGVMGDALLRHEQCVVVDAFLDARTHEHAGQQHVVGIRKYGAHGDRARARIDRDVGELKRAYGGVLGAVFQGERPLGLAGPPLLQLPFGDTAAQLKACNAR